ncbi:hypothetical protein DdX_08141 [Ditylenchus destructor]|uniref:Uncharacterized protein n=1 Tax=Ditylenchus destructor TaxID=166010 RepID=A0AAD4N1P5_9BILA|nr:hypothetical protein DdX_08141 [Ditylenchus destructor]
MAKCIFLPILAIILTVFVLVRNSEALPAEELKDSGTVPEAKEKDGDLRQTQVKMDQPLEEDNLATSSKTQWGGYGYPGWGGGYGYPVWGGGYGYPGWGGGYGGYWRK